MLINQIKYKSMKNKKMWIILGVVAVVVIWLVVGYNGLVSRQESVNQAGSNVENVYQRRADLIPNLVNTVKGYAEHEQATLQAVTDARTKATSINIDPATATQEQMDAFFAAQQEVGTSLGRLIAVAERYPDLKASANFRDLQAQLEGTENRIAVERKSYNAMVKEYNTKIRKFPANIIAGLFGFERVANWEAQEGTEVAPVVEF